MLRILEAHFRETIKNTEAHTKIHHFYTKSYILPWEGVWGQNMHPIPASFPGYTLNVDR